MSVPAGAAIVTRAARNKKEGMIVTAVPPDQCWAISPAYFMTSRAECIDPRQFLTVTPKNPGLTGQTRIFCAEYNLPSIECKPEGDDIDLLSLSQLFCPILVRCIQSLTLDSTLHANH